MCCKKKCNNKFESKSQNYCKDLEDKVDNNVLDESNKQNFEKLYYEYMKETKVSYNYAYYQLEKSKAVEEKYKVEKMTMQALELMIDQLVLNQVKEIEVMKTQTKQINYENCISKHIFKRSQS